MNSLVLSCSEWQTSVIYLAFGRGKGGRKGMDKDNIFDPYFMSKELKKKNKNLNNIIQNDGTK